MPRFAAHRLPPALGVRVPRARNVGEIRTGMHSMSWECADGGAVKIGLGFGPCAGGDGAAEFASGEVGGGE